MDQALAESDLEEFYEPVAAGTVGQNHRCDPGGRHSLGMAGQYRPSLLGEDGLTVAEQKSIPMAMAGPSSIM